LPDRIKSEVKKYLPYDNTNIQSICSYGSQLHGKSLEDIVEDKNIVINKKNKGNIGNFIQEHWFYIKPDNKKDQDFDLAGLELKCTMLERKKNNSLKVKWPLSLCAINYDDLDKETWDTSYLKHKIKNILLVFHLPDSVFLKTMIDKTSLFKLKDYEEIIQNDWLFIYNKNKDGLSHTLSGRDTKYLCTAPKSNDSKYKKKQPNSRFLAKALGFRLKSAFINTIYKQTKHPEKFDSIIDNNINEKSKSQLTNNSYKSFLIKKLNHESGKSLKMLCNENNLSLGLSKDTVPKLINKFLGFKNYKARILELELEGINIKLVKHNNNNYPYQAMSFPAEKIIELENSTWEDSKLSEYLNTLLIVPIYKPNSDTKDSECVLGSSFFWKPNDKQWVGITEEWEMYRDEFIQGKGKVSLIKKGNRYVESLGITKSKDTSYIHMRPHGAKNSDRDVDSHGNSFCKQSFWLNKKFVQEILNKVSS
tara:strand:+ start:638 stop:2068 length:1431 start_codon:yes stop_codon:yes gene_type:complete